jgi:hypothetical protein
VIESQRALPPLVAHTPLWQNFTMVWMKPTSIWKAQESLAGAESELTHRRFNNYTRDAYYACFQAATAALLNEGISPTLRRTLTDL